MSKYLTLIRIGKKVKYVFINQNKYLFNNIYNIF